MPVQHYIIAGAYLGSAPRRLVFVHGEPRLPESVLYYCRYCGEVFAKCPVDSSSQWQAYAMCCGRCPPRSVFDIPGSVYRDWDRDFVAALPEPVLRQELQRLFDLLEDAS